MLASLVGVNGRALAQTAYSLQYGPAGILQAIDTQTNSVISETSVPPLFSYVYTSLGASAEGAYVYVGGWVGTSQSGGLVAFTGTQTFGPILNLGSAISIGVISTGSDGTTLYLGTTNQDTGYPGVTEVSATTWSIINSFTFPFKGSYPVLTPDSQQAYVNNGLGQMKINEQASRFDTHTVVTEA